MMIFKKPKVFQIFFQQITRRFRISINHLPFPAFRVIPRIICRKVFFEIFFSFDHTISPRCLLFDPVCWNSSHNSSRLNVLYYNSICADDCIITNRDRAKNLRAAGDRNIVPNHGRCCFVPVSNSDLLIDPAVLSDRRGGDVSGKTVLDKESSSDFSCHDIKRIQRPIQYSDQSAKERPIAISE